MLRVLFVVGNLAHHVEEHGVAQTSHSRRLRVDGARKARNLDFIVSFLQNIQHQSLVFAKDPIKTHLKVHREIANDFSFARAEDRHRLDRVLGCIEEDLRHFEYKLRWWFEKEK